MSQFIEMFGRISDDSPCLYDVARVYDGTHKTPSYTDSGIPFISVENISNIYGSKKYISQEDYEKYKYKPEYGDVFMTRIGTIGKCAVYESTEPLAYYVSLALIKPNRELIHSKFLKYYLESSDGQFELRKRSLLKAFPMKINLGEIGKIKVMLPSKERQNEFVAMAEQADKSEFDGLKSQFIEMRNHTTTTRKKVGEVAKVMTGSTPSRNHPEYWGGSNYWVAAQDMGGKYVTDTLEKVTDEGYATCKVVPAGSVLYVCRGSIGVISINTMDCATNQSICTATCNDGYINEYLYYALKFAEGDIKKQGTGTSFKSLNQSSFAAIELDFPSIDDQKAFAEIARQADKSESAQELVRNINYN